MRIEIKSSRTGKVLFAHEAEGNTLRLTLEVAANACADLWDANLAGADLACANLAGANLAGADLACANLAGANLAGADLAGADLSGAVLRGAVLRDAVLRDAVLRDANVPAIPDLDAKILAAIEAGGALDMSDWHTCETTHCRAGWAITLAGEAGAELEAEIGPAAAGALIYAKSCPDKRIPNFYAGNEDAMADMRARAGK